MTDISLHCGNLSAHTHRPIVRLINVLWNIIRPNSRIVFTYSSDVFYVSNWFADDVMTFGQVKDAPEVYLYREMEFTFKMLGLPVILWICDDPNIGDCPARIMEHSQAPWDTNDINALQLRFLQPVADIDTNPWMPLPVEDIGIAVDNMLVRADGCTEELHLDS